MLTLNIELHYFKIQYIVILFMSLPEKDVSNELVALEIKLESLIKQYNLLLNENNELKQSKAELLKEKATLLEKNNLAKSKIELMITRLKAMEND